MTKPKDTSSDKLTAFQDSTEITDAKDTAAQSDFLTQTDTDISMIEETEDDDLDETVEDTACAQPPEAKVKIESLAPDVVVASLETSEPEEDSVENESQAHSEEVSKQEDIKLETPPDVDLPEQESDELTTYQSSTESDDTQDEVNKEEDQEEEVKEKRKPNLSLISNL
ncbi:hypothetical protein Psyaliredsea_10680 [Psychrobacter alimentarius]